MTFTLIPKILHTVFCQSQGIIYEKLPLWIARTSSCKGMTAKVITANNRIFMLAITKRIINSRLFALA